MSTFSQKATIIFSFNEESKKRIDHESLWTYNADFLEEESQQESRAVRLPGWTRS